MANTRNKQLLRAYHWLSDSGSMIMIAKPGNKLLGTPAEIVEVNKEQLDLYRMIYGDGLVVMSK